MVTIKAFNDLNAVELNKLTAYVEQKSAVCLPYHWPAFARVTDSVFRYDNLSLVAVGDNGEICGYLPQWRCGKVIESVPWRDKGGPLVTSPNALRAMLNHTVELVDTLGLKGFIWKDYCTDLLESWPYLINVEIDLTGTTPEQYWLQLSNKVRGKVRQARKNNLQFSCKKDDRNTALREFYTLFSENRKRLGVPVYPYKLFAEYAAHMDSEQMRVFNVYHNANVVASLILFCVNQKAIDAYSASSRTGLDLKANDFLLFEVISDCIDRGVAKFDFGADSPLQQSLINYKCKWLGRKRTISNAVFGTIPERDHNKPSYEPMKQLIRRMPLPLYRLVSRLIIR